jgi:undecaprenyl diphosphate synthase
MPIAQPDPTLSQPPRHVAIIMDGNGRWAKANHLPRAIGHRRGVEAMRGVTRAAKEMGIEYLTLYSFSSENWRRPAEEVNDLMGLLRHFVKNDIAEMKANGVRVTVIGDRTGLADDIAALIAEAEAETRGNDALKLQIAFNYGGQDEIVAAARKLAAEVAAGRLKPEAITKDLFARHLQTAGIPDPDLVIRTSGEQRISNFLIWQSAYAEFVFVPALWPDFGKGDLDRAIAEYRRRERRFGARLVQASP